MALKGLEEEAFGTEGPMVQNIKFLNEDSARLHEKFDKLREKYDWRVSGIGELNETKWGPFHGTFVPESSARYGDRFMMVHADHISLTKPTDKKSLQYTQLKTFIQEASRKMDVPENSQNMSWWPRFHW